jgi:methyl-accepting chemotaxis protein
VVTALGYFIVALPATFPFTGEYFLAADQVWLVGTILSMVTLLFATSLIVMIALVLSFGVRSPRYGVSSSGWRRLHGMAGSKSSVRELPRKMFGIFTVGFGYLLAALAIMGGCIGLFGGDLGRIGSKIAAFSHSLAAGDLRRPTAGWSDDELGAVSDNLRTQFSGLRALATDVSQSVTLVEEEIARLARTAASLGNDSEEQALSIARTREAVRGAPGRGESHHRLGGGRGGPRRESCGACPSAHLFPDPGDFEGRGG